jgi:hypothetical protein
MEGATDVALIAGSVGSPRKDDLAPDTIVLVVNIEPLCQFLIMAPD